MEFLKYIKTQHITSTVEKYIKIADGSYSPILGKTKFTCTVDDRKKSVIFLIAPEIPETFIVGANFCETFELLLHFGKMNLRPFPTYGKQFTFKKFNDNRPFIDITLSNKVFSVLADTGATNNLMGSPGIEFLKNKNLFNPKFSKTLGINIANGSLTKVIGQISLEITLNNVQRTIDFLIVPAVPQSFILGADFLHEFNLTLNFRTRSWQMPSENIEIMSNSKETLNLPKITETSIYFAELTFPENTENIEYIEPNFEKINEISKNQNELIFAQVNTPSEINDELISEELINVTDNKAILTDEQSILLNATISKFNTLSTAASGCVTVANHDIQTLDSKPFKKRPFNLSPAMQVHLHKEIDEMLKDGVIQPSNSPYSSPFLLVKKKNDEYRFCFDGRTLNAITVKDSYPLPRIDSILNRLRNTKYFSSIDLRKAFWQIKLSERSRQKTAFCVPGRGLFEFLVMPFGLSNSPQTLQRVMDEILGSLIHTGKVFVFLDDIMVISETFSEHIDTLNNVYECLKKAGFRINTEKCNFCMRSLTFLGFVVDETGIRTDPSKVECIQRFKTPKTTTEVKRLIGMVSYYRIFLPDLSTISSPITALIKNKKKGQTITWNNEAEIAFEKIKELISTAPILISPDFSKPFFLQTDSSAVGLGVVLFQEKDGLEHPIAYASRALTSAEQKYHATERELLAILFAINKFRGYIEGTHFTVITDCSALQWLSKFDESSGRLARWSLKLAQHSFDVRHRPGKLNIVPDILSRDVCLIKAQNLVKDDWYHQLETNVLEEPEKYPQFKVENDFLYKLVPTLTPNSANQVEFKLIIPLANRKEVLKQCHDDPTSGHFGIAKTISRVTELYYWPKMISDVKNYVLSCEICCAQKSSQQARPGLMGKPKHVSYPFQLISMDLLGPLPRSKKGNQHLLVITDWFTKYVIVKPLTKATAIQITRFLEQQVFLVYGIPQVILCDNGVQFTSHLFKELLSKYDVQKTYYNCKFHPQFNPTERVNRVLVTAISSYITNDHTRWDENIYKIALAINTAKHEVTNFSPSFLVFGRYIPTDGSYYGPVPTDTDVFQVDERIRWDETQQQLPTLFADVRKSLQRAYLKSKQHYDLRKRPLVFQVGDIVWKRNFALSDASKQFSHKLAPKYLKCQVIAKHGDLAYRLKLVDSQKQIGVWHLKDLKSFHSVNQ